jgi:hypothetical protein
MMIVMKDEKDVEDENLVLTLVVAYSQVNHVVLEDDGVPYVVVVAAAAVVAAVAAAAVVVVVDYY